MTLYIGLMSGTSMDGIDAALVELPTHTLVCGITINYSDELKNRLNHLICGNQVTLATLCQLHTLVGKEFAGAVNELIQTAGISTNEVVAIGSHGQTVVHQTTGNIPYTLQLGCGHTISTMTQMNVVADFRTRDLVNGGQGAPFAPLYHQELFRTMESDTAIVNIGGIANITFLSPSEPTVGWDVGPGNCLMDAWIYKNQGEYFDRDGTWASQGRVDYSLLDRLLADSFFHHPSPKSIGKEYFSLTWLEQYLPREYSPIDIQATLSALSANVIAQSVTGRQHQPKKLYLCGGGTHNLHLQKNLAAFLPHTLVKSIADIGVSPDFLEAMMFAWLADQTIHFKKQDLSAITGSSHPAILGAIYPIKPLF